MTSKPEPSRLKINEWVAENTKDRIKNLLAEGSITSYTRLVLANAIYLKAAWAQEFSLEENASFFVDGTKELKAKGLRKFKKFGYMKINGGTIVTIHYSQQDLQFVLMIPDEKMGLVAKEKALTVDIFKQAAATEYRNIDLHFPSFKLEPDSVALVDHLVAMGMPSAFQSKSADFSRMEKTKMLFISAVVHKALIAVDQYGTELRLQLLWA